MIIYKDTGLSIVCFRFHNLGPSSSRNTIENWQLMGKNSTWNCNFLQNYWVFGFFQSSDILENRKHDVSENVVVGLERGSLSLVSIIEELLEWKSSGSGLENRD
jgi:hypothetical protein